jgi:hypothetical protein
MKVSDVIYRDESFSLSSRFPLFLAKKKGFVYGVECHFQQYFSYIVAISFIDEGNWRKLPTSQTLSHKLY